DGTEPLENCDGADGAATRTQIQKLVLSYEANLNHLGRIDAVSQNRMKDARESSKNELLALIATRDSSCFNGVADISVLCAELAHDSSIKTPEGLSIPFASGYTLTRRKLPNGKYTSAWTLVNSKGETQAFLSDKDHDGKLDTAFLAGAFANQTTQSERKVLGINTSIDENSASFGAGTTVDLRTDAAYADMFGAAVPVARNCAYAGDPAQVLGAVASDKKWNPRDSDLTWDKTLMNTMRAAGEGYQKGTRGLVVGAQSGATSLVGGVAMLGKGGWSYVSNPEVRHKVNTAVSGAFGKVGPAFKKLYDECAAEGSFYNPVAISFCMDYRAGKAGVKALGPVVKSVGEQMKKCWTAEGAEFKEEYFSECMGTFAFNTAITATGVGMSKNAASILATSESMAARAGARASAFVGEFVFDQVGVAGLGSNKLSRLKDVVKVANEEAKVLGKAGLELNAAEGKAVAEHLKQVARASASAGSTPPPELAKELAEKIRKADPEALARWEKEAANAVSDTPVAPVKMQPAPQALSRETAVQDYKKAFLESYGPKGPTPEQLEHMNALMKNSEWGSASLQGMARTMDEGTKFIADAPAFSKHVDLRRSEVALELAEANKKMTSPDFAKLSLDEQQAQREARQMLTTESKDLERAALDHEASRRVAGRHSLRSHGLSEEEITKALDCYR
ncbi:MAG: hypothetical protein ABIR96_01810, partial [Bdellovibrionota bacterium]